MIEENEEKYNIHLYMILLYYNFLKIYDIWNIRNYLNYFSRRPKSPGFTSTHANWKYKCIHISALHVVNTSLSFHVLISLATAVLLNTKHLLILVVDWLILEKDKNKNKMFIFWPQIKYTWI